jgi:hypothetical protein
MKLPRHMAKQWMQTEPWARIDCPTHDSKARARGHDRARPALRIQHLYLIFPTPAAPSEDVELEVEQGMQLLGR